MVLNSREKSRTMGQNGEYRKQILEKVQRQFIGKAESFLTNDARTTDIHIQKPEVWIHTSHHILKLFKMDQTKSKPEKRQT